MFSAYAAANPHVVVFIVFAMLAGHAVLAAFLVTSFWDAARWTVLGLAAVLLAIGWFAP